MTPQPEYLLGYGVLGDFGRFYPVAPLTCRRGQRAVARTPRGLEVATVLGEARPGHAHYLPNTTVGQLLRLAGADDLATERRRRDEARRMFDEARAVAAAVAVPLEVIDVEVLLDGEHAVIHHLRRGDFDPRPFVSRLSTTFDCHVALFDLTRPAVEEPSESGCGRPDCGSASGGGCGSEGGCGSGGGCSTCGLKNVPDLKKYFAGLRRQMEEGGRPHVGGR
jgi:cell fate regulator YaaT (PSP1 superfamily)